MMVERVFLCGCWWLMAEMVFLCACWLVVVEGSVVMEEDRCKRLLGLG